ncbi:hypothetical protein BGW41_002263 [Actinomortierella wolfii]|nr:hypothetical protein BGW41_002263 [Actinomortierella wolfii]
MCPFNIKEHVLIVIMAACGTGTAYAVDIVVIQRVFYDQNFGFLANLLLIITTQMVGYGMAGILRRYLVYPAAMVWPANLATVALFNTLHRQGQNEDNERHLFIQGGGGVSSTRSWSRQQFFVVVTAASFLYYWLPAYIFPALTALTVLCWIDPSNLVLSQVTGANGLGIGVISLDWNTITAFLGSPLVTPWWAQVNMLVGFIICAWIIFPAAYYANLWEAKQFPIVSSKLYTVQGDIYDTMSILTPQKTLDNAKYAGYGPLRITTFFAILYGIGFASLTAILTHTFLYQRHQIWASWKQSRGRMDFGDEGGVAEAVDIHYKLMQAYEEVPEWWYILLFVVMTVLSIITCEVWDYGLPWWCVLLALAISIVFALPIGLIQAVTNQQPGLNVITEFVIGYILPGRPIANVVFKTYGYISMAHAMAFVGDLKLGQYMKIPPRAMFWTQMLGTVIAAFVNLITANWLLDTRPHICTPEGTPWGCPAANVFFSASVIFLPIPFYILGRLFPAEKGYWIGRFADQIHIPVLLNSVAAMPVARAFQYTNWSAVGFIFQYWIRKYYREWHEKYTYLTSAALDSGVALSALVIFFCLQMHGIEFPTWWGVTQDAEHQCPLDRANFYGVIPTKKQTVT